MFDAKKTLAKSLRNAREYFLALNDREGVNASCHEIQVPWRFPNNGFHKLNTDGASVDGVIAGTAGVIRDDDGKFVACYCEHIYFNGSNDAEVWAVRDGLKIVVDLGIQKLEVESDSTYTIQLCEAKINPLWRMQRLIEDIKMLKTKFTRIVFNHEYREANGAADCLAKLANKKVLEGKWLQIAPEVISRFLNEDISSRVTPRLVRNMVP
ncbi:hypothetical protein C5167_049083 [Papaver somniferum]|uniref:RNase H type-1 domain-containing protein n=1 Tax=Papaver somniferum TaxID=3469 RepID=A0A4Y7KL86_PAPSO|nr:hypothetical protein C5167_049083 [Papaver somniferum]